MVRTALLLLALSTLAHPQGVDTSRARGRPLALPKGDDVFHFVIYGDRTGGKPAGIPVLKQAVRETNLLDPDLVMTVGDLVNGYNTTEKWLEEMKEYRSVMDGLRMRWYPVAGNHDVYWRGPNMPAGQHEANYEKHFGPLWYSFRHKNAAFIVLFSDEGDRKANRKGWRYAKVNRFSDEQLAWLKTTLAKSKDADHVFVFLHHPRWIDHIYPDSNWDAVHAQLKAADNVRAVFAGHIHRRRYDGKRDGIEYMTLAVVGGRLPYEARGTGWLNHFNVVTVRKNRVSYASIAVGATLDPKAMTPAHWEEVDLLRALRGEHEGAVKIAPDGDASGEYAIRYTNPTKRPINLVLEGGGGGWWFSPDHHHARLEPGATHAFRFAYGRVPKRGAQPPSFELGVEYLGPTQRVSLPVRTVPATTDLVGLDPEFWKGESNLALRVERDRSGVGFASSKLDVPDGPFTVEAWVKLNKINKRAGVLAKSERSEFGLLLYAGVPNFLVHLNGRYVTAKSSEGRLRLNQWTHLAGVFDGKSVRIYVNGQLAGKKKGAGARTRNDLPVFVGADPDKNGQPSNSFDGWIDEVRVSRIARYTGSTLQPERRFAPDKDTLLLLHFDRALAAMHPDHSSTGAHGRPTGRVRLEPVRKP